VPSPVYFALSGLYGLSPVNLKRLGSSAIICKPVTNFPIRLHLAKLQGHDSNMYLIAQMFPFTPPCDTNASEGI
jgi:hypothetical protein